MKISFTHIMTKYDALWITLMPSITMDNYHMAESQIIESMTGCKNQNIVLDLSSIDTLFSSGVGLIIRLNRCAQGLKKQLYCVNITEKIREGFRLMGLDKIITFCASEQEYALLVNDTS